MPTAAEVVQARQRVENLTVEETAREPEAGNALLVDIREPGERAQHRAIPGAIEAVGRGHASGPWLHECRAPGRWDHGKEDAGKPVE